MENKIIEKEDNNIDLRSMVKELRKYWLLFVIFLFFTLGIAFLFNRFAAPVYQVGSKLLISLKETRSSADRTDFLEGLELTSPNKEFQNEISVLSSSILTESVVKYLGFHVSYYFKEDYLPYRFPITRRFGKLLLREIYKDIPFEVVLNLDHQQPVSVNFNFKISNNEEFILAIEEKDVEIYDYKQDLVIYDNKNIFINDKFKFGEEIKGLNYSFKIFLSSKYNDEYIDKDLYFSFNNIKGLANAYANALEIIPTDEQATVVDISFAGGSIAKSIDFVNGLTNEYLQKDLAKKNYLAVTTIDYIDRQISNISDSLNLSERELQSFRRQYRVMNIDEKSQRVYQQLSELERQKNEVTRQLRFYQELYRHFEDNKDSPNLLAPSSMGVADPVLNNMIQQLADYNAEKNTLIERRMDRNPRFRTLSVQIEDLKKSISKNIEFFVSSTESTLEGINSNIALASYEERRLPQTKTRLQEIERKFDLNDDIYTFLLRKKAEAQIAKASNLPDSEIIESAHFFEQIFPRKKRNYLLAFFVGFFFPFAFLQIKKSLNNKIIDKNDVEKITKIPIIGKIIHNQNKEANVVLNNSVAPISDNYRSLRTNIEFYSNGKENLVILVTSSMGEEGKSFNSMNLASILAINEKKTILLGFDLRKPSELYNEFEVDDNKGISSFLIGKADLNDIIYSTKINNLDFIPTGLIPPNPLELILSQKTELLFSQLKENYDNIVIDSSPVGILPEAFVLMRHSDLNLLVVRENFTLRNYLKETLQELNQKEVDNLYIIYNDEKILKSDLKYKHYYYSKQT